MSLAIIVPVLNRPRNVKPLLDSIRVSTPEPFRVLFVCDPGDIAEQDAIAKEGGWMISPGGTYSEKINAGCRATNEPLVMLAADDLRFLRGWLEAAKHEIDRGAQVVGVNDMIRRRPHRRQHATHFLITREYAQRPCIDGSPGPMSVAYLHTHTDDELIATATKRGVYRYAPASRVRHLHPDMRTAPDDSTYRKGRASFERDRATFRKRQALWA